MEHNNSTYRDKVTAGPVYRGCGISSETGLKHKIHLARTILGSLTWAAFLLSPYVLFVIRVIFTRSRINNVGFD